MTPIVCNDGPEVSGLRFSPSGNRGAGFVHEYPVHAFQALLKVIGDRAQMKAGAPDPDAERRSVQRDPLSGADFLLAVEWKMAAGRDKFRRMRLDHRAG